LNAASLHTQEVRRIAQSPGSPSGLELFTVNRWVTDEWLVPASVLIERLRAFDLANAPGDPLIARWLSALIAFYAPDISKLARARDEAIAGWPAERFEDPSIEVLTALPIHINDAVEASS
jgi:hypothetical protein